MGEEKKILINIKLPDEKTESMALCFDEVGEIEFAKVRERVNEILENGRKFITSPRKLTQMILLAIPEEFEHEIISEGGVTKIMVHKE